MKWRHPFSLLLLGTCVVAAMAVASLPLRHADQEATSPLVVDEATLDLGALRWTPNFTWELPIRNAAHEDIQITQFARSCNCATIKPETLLIPAGSTEHVTLTADFSRSDSDWPATIPRYQQEFSVSILATYRRVVDDAVGRVRWRFQGQMHTSWVGSPPTIDFGDDLIRSRGAVGTTLIVCERPVERLWAKCEPSLARVKVRTKDDDGREHILSVSLEPGLPVGHHEFQVNLEGVSPEGRQLSGLPVFVEATVKGVAEAVPASLDFGVRSVGTKSSAELMLQPREGRPFKLMEVKRASEELEVREINADEDRAEYVYRVSQPISRLGQQSTAITFSLQMPASYESQEIVVPVSYFGVSSPDDIRLPEE